MFRMLFVMLVSRSSTKLETIALVQLAACPVGALVAVFAICAMTAAGASAHEFEASGTVFPKLLLASADGPQVFITLAGTLTCQTLTGHGEVLAKVAKTQKSTVAYSNCVAEGRFNLTAKPSEPINVEYEFNAEGSVTILKEVKIHALLGGSPCDILVAAQGPLWTVKYDNILSNTKILILAHITGIETSSKGVGCIEVYSSSKTGLYLGNTIVEADGSNISWK